MNRNSNKDKEDILVARLHSGEREVISVLYDKYHKALFGVCFQILKDQGRAEDALQKSFIKIWKKGKNYDPGKGRLYTWLLNITRNTAIDIYRSESRNKTIRDEEFNVHLLEHIRSDEINTDAMDVNEKVESLDQKYRELIRLSYLGGYTQQEISKLLKMPLGTVKTRIRTAMQQLRKIYNDK